MTTAEEWITSLRLEPHPEGGFFREAYRSTETIEAAALPDRFESSRVHSTSIYFLLRAGDVSALHRIKQDEIWYFHDGDRAIVHRIDSNGRRSSHPLGRDPSAGESLQVVVRSGDWFGAEVSHGGRFALVGCTVAPGFEFEDLEMADRSELTAHFPEHAELIARLTPGHSGS